MQRTNAWRDNNRKTVGDEHKDAVRDSIVNASAKRLELNTDASRLRVCRTAHLGIHCTEEEKFLDGRDPIPITEFREMHPDFALIEWSGKYVVQSPSSSFTNHALQRSYKDL